MRYGGCITNVWAAEWEKVNSPTNRPHPRPSWMILLAPVPPKPHFDNAVHFVPGFVVPCVYMYIESMTSANRLWFGNWCCSKLTFQCYLSSLAFSHPHPSRHPTAPPTVVSHCICGSFGSSGISDATNNWRLMVNVGVSTCSAKPSSDDIDIGLYIK